MSASNDKSDDIMLIPGAEDTIDASTFEQILEMDDDDEVREFSRSIVYDFFGQADSTFKKMDTALEGKGAGNLKELSELGHFLKGSSATLGLIKVRDECEKIQNFGSLKDKTGLHDITADESLKLLAVSIKNAKADFAEVKTILKKFYKDEDK